MSEKELKAIENYKMFEDAIKQTISKGDRELYVDNLKAALRDTRILLNLIEKQQKEIEKLRIKNGKEFVRGVETNEKSWKAKIRLNIKELKEQAKISQGEELLIIDAKIDMLEELKGE